jgi:hypothetical protein
MISVAQAIAVLQVPLLLGPVAGGDATARGVRSSVEQALNELLEAKADQIFRPGWLTLRKRTAP